MREVRGVRALLGDLQDVVIRGQSELSSRPEELPEALYAGVTVLVEDQPGPGSPLETLPHQLQGAGLRKQLRRATDWPHFYIYNTEFVSSHSLMLAVAPEVKTTS